MNDLHLWELFEKAITYQERVATLVEERSVVLVFAGQSHVPGVVDIVVLE